MGLHVERCRALQRLRGALGEEAYVSRKQRLLHELLSAGAAESLEAAAEALHALHASGFVESEAELAIWADGLLDEEHAAMATQLRPVSASLLLDAASRTTIAASSTWEAARSLMKAAAVAAAVAAARRHSAPGGFWSSLCSARWTTLPSSSRCYWLEHSRGCSSSLVWCWAQHSLFASASSLPSSDHSPSSFSSCLSLLSSEGLPSTL